MTTKDVTVEHQDTLERRPATATLDPKGNPTYVTVPLWGPALRVDADGYVCRGNTRTGWRVTE